MFRQGQRCGHFCTALALLAFLVGCSSGTDDNANAVVSPTTSVAAETPTLPPFGEQDESGETAQEEAQEQAGPSDLSIADGLAGMIVQRAGNGDLLTSGPDGTNVVEWASGSSVVSTQPTWSTNGQSLAWTVFDASGPALAIGELAAGPDAIEFTPAVSPSFYLSWSPNDRWIAGLRNGESGMIELVLFDTDSGELRIVGPGQPLFTDWQGNDELIAAIGGFTLIDVPADEAIEPIRRDLDRPLGVFQAPVALPNGDVVVALEEAGDNEVVRLSGTDAEPLARATGPVSMSVDPTGDTLAVLVVADDEVELISYRQSATPDLPPGRVSLIDMNSGRIETLPYLNVLAMSWSPDGQHIALLEVDAGLTWSFVDPTTGALVERGATFVPTEELATAYLPFADQYDRSSTWWSPDGDGFVYSGSAYGESGVWVDRVGDGAGPALLGDGDIAFWSPN